MMVFGYILTYDSKIFDSNKTFFSFANAGSWCHKTHNTTYIVGVFCTKNERRIEIKRMILFKLEIVDAADVVTNG